MNLVADRLTLTQKGDAFLLRVGDGPSGTVETFDVRKIVRVFPQSHPDAYISFLDAFGHEVGLLEDLDGLNPDSKGVLDALVREQYFVPTILSIVSVVRTGSGSVWSVRTDEGDAEFRLVSRDALDGDAPPAILVTPTEGRRYRIPDYWALDRECRELIVDLLPDKILRYRMARPRSDTPERKRRK
jgi:hypothetical protein